MRNDTQTKLISESLLRNTLLVNMVFSTVSGILILIFAAELSAILFEKPFSVFGFGPEEVLIEAAIGILIFAAFVLFVAKRVDVNQNLVCVIMAMDVAWVIGSAALLFLFGGYFSTAGFWSVLSIAAIVADFAIFQGIGVARINRAIGAINVRLGKHA